MWEALVGVLGALAGTWLGYGLSKKAADEQWQRELLAAREQRVVDLAERLLIMATDGAVAVVADDRRQRAAAITALAATATLLNAHCSRSHPDLRRLVDECMEGFSAGENAQADSAALVTLIVVLELWLYGSERASRPIARILGLCFLKAPHGHATSPR